MQATAIILAAGKGKRMRSSVPKVLHQLASRPMVKHVIATVESLNISAIQVVVSKDADDVQEITAPYPCIIQEQQLGTGHAVQVAVKALRSDSLKGTVLVLYGDTPLIYADTLRRMLSIMESRKQPAVVVLGFLANNPNGYGRLVTHGDTLEAIIEEKDANLEQKKISFCNSGVMAIRGELLPMLLSHLTDDNAQGEYYLTDIVKHARAQGLFCGYIDCDEQEVQGINSREQLARAESIIQQRLRKQAMEGGVTMIDPASVTLAYDTRLGQDIVIEPHVFFGPGVVVEDHVHIKAFCHMEGAHLGRDTTVGPFARLRPGTETGEGVKIGNFVETKKATLNKGAKVSHLSYIGDATVGEEANVGAGTITCNYDGTNKHHTEIGAHAFIGSNTALVAPVTIGAGAIVAAGSTITKDVPAGSLAIARGEQTVLEGKATAIKARQKAKRG